MNAMPEAASATAGTQAHNTSHLSLRDLEPTLALRLRALHARRSYWNAVCLLFPFGWIGTALLMEHMPALPIYWPVRLMGVIIIAICIQAMAILMHEALHGNLFRRVSLDRWAIFVFGLPAFFSGTAYKVAHLNHHRSTRTEHDQDEISNLCRTPGQYRLLFYMWFFSGTFIYILVVPWKAFTIGTRAERRHILMEYSAIVGTYSVVTAWAIGAHHADWLLWYWLLPAQIAMFLSNIRGLAEHLCTSMDSVITRTRTTRSNRLVSFLMLNLNYHLEHHLFPGVPWYNLPEVHRELGLVYATTHPYFERSYFRYALHAFFRGPFQQIRDLGGKTK